MGSSRTRDRTCVSCIGRRILNHWNTREVDLSKLLIKINNLLINTCFKTLTLLCSPMLNYCIINSAHSRPVPCLTRPAWSHLTWAWNPINILLLLLRVCQGAVPSFCSIKINLALLSQQVFWWFYGRLMIDSNNLHHRIVMSSEWNQVLKASLNSNVLSNAQQTVPKMVPNYHFPPPPLSWTAQA